MRRLRSFLPFSLMRPCPPFPDGARKSRRAGVPLIVVVCLTVAFAAALLIDRALQREESDSPSASVMWAPDPSVVARLGPQSGQWHDWVNSTLPAGTEAPDFSLPDAAEGGLVRLSDLWKARPVVLLLGSFSCDRFCDDITPVAELQQRYQDRAEFVFVYVAEAGHRVPRLESLFADLQPTPESRGTRALRGMAATGLSCRCVLDEPDGRVAAAYSAWPRRLVGVDRHGKIAADAGRGLQSHWDLTELEAWLGRQ